MLGIVPPLALIDSTSPLALGTIAVWAVTAAWLSAWLVHRYRVAEDSEGWEFAELSAATCPHCLHEVTAIEALPLRSLRCAECGERLPSSWWITQLLTFSAICAVAAAWGLGVHLVAFLWLPPVLVVAAVVDFRTMLIPKKVAWVGLAGGVATIALASALLGKPDMLVPALIGAAGYFGFLFLLNVISPSAMGFGDVRLGAVLGLYLGWISVFLPVYGLLVACIVYLLYAVPARIRFGLANKFSPFGPGLAMGTLLVVIFHSAILPG